jgi:hypothetical protein
MDCIRITFERFDSQSQNLKEGISRETWAKVEGWCYEYNGDSTILVSGCGLMCCNIDNEASVSIKGVNMSVLLFS